MLKSKKRIYIIAGTILLFIVAMILFTNNQKRETDDKDKSAAKEKKGGDKDKPLNINAQIIRYETLDDIIKTIGSLMPDEEVNLSFEASGKIIKIYFQEGTKIQKGQLLAKVNDGPLQAELRMLEAQLPLAKDRVFRQKSLLAKDAVSQEAYEQVTTELDKLNAQIELVKSQIDQTELRAPFEGIIGLRQVSEGAFASPTTIIAKLTKITPLKIEFSINERQANSIKAGTRLNFWLQDDPNIYQATVYAIESEVDTKTRTLKVRAIYPNNKGALKPGRSASIDIKLQEMPNALTVPTQAVIAEMGRDIIYLYKGGKARQVEITKGIRTESKLQVVKGVKAGDTLIVTGVMQLRDDMNVVIENMVK